MGQASVDSAISILEDTESFPQQGTEQPGLTSKLALF